MDITEQTHQPTKTFFSLLNNVHQILLSIFHQCFAAAVLLKENNYIVNSSQVHFIYRATNRNFILTS